MELDSYERLEADYARLKKQLEICQVSAANHRAPLDVSVES